jgi:hypothetical protein
MGLLSCSLVFIPFILVLAFFAGRRDQSWLVIGWRSFVYAWVIGLLLVMGVLFLPSYQLIDRFVSPVPKPFDVLYASMIYLIPFLALILATLLLHNGFTLIKQKPPSEGEMAQTETLYPNIPLGWH